MKTLAKMAVVTAALAVVFGLAAQAPAGVVVYWNIGGPRVVVAAPAPRVVVAPAPVYYSAPAPVYYSGAYDYAYAYPPVYYAPAYAPAYAYYPRPYYYAPPISFGLGFSFGGHHHHR